jgi:hypothetical protein
VKANEDYFFENNVSRLLFEAIDLRKAKAYREFSLGEYGRLDVFVEIPGDLALLIEVKLFSSEGEDQTKRYEQWAMNKIGNKVKLIIFCYLTPEGSSAEGDRFLPFSFDELNKVFNREQALEQLHNNDKFLLRNFIEWIKGVQPMDTELRNLCRKIYTKYKAEIDMIQLNIPSITAFFRDMASYVNEGYGNKYFAHSGANWITISPKEWLKENKLRESTKYTLPRIEYNYYSETLNFCFVIPQEGKIHDIIESKSEGIFSQKFKDVEFYRNWGKKYLHLEKPETFIPENIVDSWDANVRSRAEKTVNSFDKITEIVSQTELTK